MVAVLASVVSCSTVYPLKNVAKRAAEPRTLKRDVHVDTASRDIGRMQSVAWVAYAATFECAKDCTYSDEERTRLSRDIAEASFAALDRELRKALGSSNRTLQNVDETLKTPAFGTAVIEIESYASKVGRWFERLGLVRATEATVAARGLKTVNPNELGWSGEESLSRLGRKLGVDAVAVGHLRITVENGAEGQPSRLVVQGPKIWFFSAHAAKSLVVAELRPGWKLETPSAGALDVVAFDDVAVGFGTRVAQGLSD